MKEISIMIEGAPVPKGRPRFMRNGHTYTPEKTRQAEAYVRAEYIEQCEGYQFPPDVPLAIHCDFYMPIPKGTSKKKRAEMHMGTEQPLKKPDIDNLLKLILDALNGTAYEDDKQIVRISARKRYTDNMFDKGYTWVTIKED